MHLESNVKLKLGDGSSVSAERALIISGFWTLWARLRWPPSYSV